MRLDSMNQGSPEWLKLRKEKITATDAAIIMGKSRYKTPFELWLQKMDLAPPDEVTQRMEEGTRLEPYALEKLSKLLNVKLSPAVIISNEKNWQMASLDALSEDGLIMGEIKCGPKTCELAKKNIIDPIYVYQMQHHMSANSLSMMYFFTFNEVSHKIIEIERDDKLIKEMDQVESNFFHKYMMDFEAPPLSERDYVIRNDEEWKKASEMYLASCHRVKFWEEEQEYWRKSLIESAGSSNVKGAGVRVAKSVRKGTVDYKAIPELKGLDLEPYRKKPSEYWRIGIE